MDAYRHFTVASYMYAYYVREATDQQIREGVEKYLRCLPLSKVYVENHRATTDIPIKRLKEVRGDPLPAGGVRAQGLRRDHPHRTARICL